MAYGEIESYGVKSSGLNLVLSVQVALTESSPLGIRAHSLILSFICGALLATLCERSNWDRAVL